MPKNVAQPQDKYVLRLPDGMREHLKAAAAGNGRSMNAEIVARLDGYEELKEHVEELAFDLQRLERERDALLEEQEERKISEDHTIYVLLDVDGMPISWQEIYHHLGEIGRAGGFKINRMEAHIFDAVRVGSSDREEEYFHLYERYRKLRKQKKGPAKPSVEEE